MRRHLLATESIPLEICRSHPQYPRFGSSMVDQLDIGLWTIWHEKHVGYIQKSIALTGETRDVLCTVLTAFFHTYHTMNLDVFTSMYKPSLEQNPSSRYRLFHFLLSHADDMLWWATKTFLGADITHEHLW